VSTRHFVLPPAIAKARLELRSRWASMAPRERHAITAALVLIGLFLVWSVAVQPAWRTLREAPAQLDQLDAQLQQMTRLASESRELRGATPVSGTQAMAALQSATERLGAQGRLAIQGDRVTLTLIDTSPEALKAWLGEARSAARARPVEAQLSRASTGYSGTIVLSLGGAS
jgi:general secretion pathway protein M